MVTIQTAPTLFIAMVFFLYCHCFTLIMLIVLWAYAIWSIKLFFFLRPFLNCLLGLIDQTTCYFSSSVELAFCTLLGLRLPNLETIAAPALLLLLLSLNSSMVVGLLQLEAQNFFLLFIPTPPHRVVYQTLLLKMIKNDMILEIMLISSSIQKMSRQKQKLFIWGTYYRSKNHWGCKELIRTYTFIKYLHYCVPNLKMNTIIRVVI